MYLDKLTVVSTDSVLYRSLHQKCTCFYICVSIHSYVNMCLCYLKGLTDTHRWYNERTNTLSKLHLIISIQSNRELNKLYVLASSWSFLINFFRCRPILNSKTFRIFFLTTMQLFHLLFFKLMPTMLKTTIALFLHRNCLLVLFKLLSYVSSKLSYIQYISTPPHLLHFFLRIVSSV